MKINTLSILLILSLAFLGSISEMRAQEHDLNKAERDYEQLNYVDAREVYLKTVENGYHSEEILTKLANIYYFNAEYYKAVEWYKRLFEESDPEEAMLYLRYAQALKATGEVEKAKNIFEQYNQKGQRDTTRLTVADYQDMIELNADRYEVKVLEELYDENQITYGHTVQNEKLTYASTEPLKRGMIKKKDAWTGMSYMSLYEVPIDSVNQLAGEPEKLDGEIQGKFHQSSATYTRDGQTMYFTRNNYTAENKKNKLQEKSYLKIYRTHQDERGKWKKPEDLSINGNDFSTGHPALSPNDSVLYFASDRAGGYGETDLWQVEIKKDGSLGEPKNLGSKINTEARESFPFMAKDSVLYFSSDGHFGLGGLDVFAIKLQEDGSFGSLINLGEPINSPADDFSYGIDTDTRYGFFSSDRNQASDTSFVKTNIYSFKEEEPVEDPYEAWIVGCVTDKDTEEPLPDSKITLTELDSNEFYKSVMTDEEGCYKVEINKFDTYTVRAEKEDYDTDEKVSKPKKDHQVIDFQLKRNRQELKTGVDLAKVLNIPLIYFDFDKSNIRDDAAADLEKVYQVLLEFSDLRLNIRSHTDSRGSDAYNQALSERRAKSTRDYLVSKGIDKTRLEIEGLGERELVNECKDGVPCSAEKHQENRRSEFIVLEGEPE